MEEVNFKVGQEAEMRTFEKGFRGAWFRCKITAINIDKILLDYFDFDLEDPSWVEIYQLPPYGRNNKSKHKKTQLMVRPPYPNLYHKDQMPPLTSISEPCVVLIDATWKVGNLVDWFKDDCYWSATIIKVITQDKFQIELPMPPVGQGKKGEEGKHEAFGKDLRPSLDWSETKGWTFLPVMKEGLTSCDAELIFPTNQGTDVEVEHAVADGAVNAASLISTEGDIDSEKNEDTEVEHTVTDGAVNASSSATLIEAEGDSEKNEDVVVAVNASSSASRIPAEGDRDRDSEQNVNVKLNCGLVESSDSVSSLRVEKRKAPEPAEEVEERELNIMRVEKEELNVMREHTLEAALLDLEGLVNKVSWMQRLLESPATTTSSWKFA